jgi:hypothetical protein
MPGERELSVDTGSYEWMRGHLIQRLNDDAAEVVEKHDRARRECAEFARRKRWLADQVDVLNISPEECRPMLSFVHKKERLPKEGEDSFLIEQAKDLVDANYEIDKYNGRDARAFVEAVFERISPELYLHWLEQK